MKKPAKIEAMNAALAERKAKRAVPKVSTIVERSKDYATNWQGLCDNADSFAAFSMHLYHFKSKELWKESGRKSFKEFCEKEVMPLMKVPLALSRMYQLAEYQEIRLSLPPKVSKILETESQVMALKAAEPEERAEIIKAVASDAKATGGKVTAAAITSKIEEKKPKEKPTEAEFEELDKTGHAIPKSLRVEWARADKQGKDLVTMLTPAKKAMEDGIGYDVIFSELTNNETGVLRNVIQNAKRIIPHAVCPTCDGKGGKCKHCKGRGFISKFMWSLVPDDQRKGRE